MQSSPKEEGTRAPWVCPLYCFTARTGCLPRARRSCWVNWGWLPWKPVCFKTWSMPAQNKTRYLHLCHWEPASFSKSCFQLFLLLPISSFCSSKLLPRPPRRPSSLTHRPRSCPSHWQNCFRVFVTLPTLGCAHRNSPNACTPALGWFSTKKRICWH